MDSTDFGFGLFLQFLQVDTIFLDLPKTEYKSKKGQ